MRAKIVTVPHLHRNVCGSSLVRQHLALEQHSELSQFLFRPDHLTLLLAAEQPASSVGPCAGRF
jgi:hypothetical protein